MLCVVNEHDFTVLLYFSKCNDKSTSYALNELSWNVYYIALLE